MKSASPSVFQPSTRVLPPRLVTTPSLPILTKSGNIRWFTSPVGHVMAGDILPDTCVYTLMCTTMPGSPLCVPHFYLMVAFHFGCLLTDARTNGQIRWLCLLLFTMLCILDPLLVAVFLSHKEKIATGTDMDTH